MLCSVCNKNNAIIFIDKVENGKSSVEGLCIDCAKKRGINPEETLKHQAEFLAQNGSIENMTKQIENILTTEQQRIFFEKLEGYSLKEIAENNGIKPKRVYKQFGKIKNVVADVMELQQLYG